MSYALCVCLVQYYVPREEKVVRFNSVQLENGMWATNGSQENDKVLESNVICHSL